MRDYYYHPPFDSKSAFCIVNFKGGYKRRGVLSEH